ncbi:hypothetical protein N7510_003776 [Penicillium lagena]|uniref:uncharacterized protein n=1 Tax=Penicillium lagena TaxID=94218 RepID=UPI002541BF0F|nr:uncharacterized protein N7510_003776 [Penicillium lagena]KAJ5619792.1 hypothetical protein N7510_003776 [Penicillium lagena]
MNNPAGNTFDWDPQSGHWCIFMYGVKGCSLNNTADAVGYTCKTWGWPNHSSTKQIYSYQVLNDTLGYVSSSIAAAQATSTDSSTASSTNTATSTGVHDQPSATATPTSSSDSETGSSAPINQKQNDSSSLSGGAIAGIVVGVLAAVIIAGVLFFFLYWRRRKYTKSPQTEKDLGAYASPSSPAPMSATTDNKTELQGSSEKALLEKDGLEPGQKLGELQGSRNHVIEMEQGTVRAELDGSPR